MVFSLAAAAGDVVISELYYNPVPNGDRTFEFVELLNTSDSEIDLSRWRLSEGARFTFPDGVSVPASGTVVVCRRKARLVTAFPALAQAAAVYGDFDGSLDDAGERVTLRDGKERLIDTVVYHDRFPWPEEADGGGLSLHRVSSRVPAFAASNWVGAPPNPLQAETNVIPVSSWWEPPEVVISEIHYHPYLDRDEDYEFVEIYNRSGTPVDLSAWSLVGVDAFVFPQGVLIEPEGYFVIARNAAVLKADFGLEQVIGNYQGKLSNRGELLSLRDADGTVVDAVYYGSSGDWPAVCDGGGHSLERVSSEAPSEDPANWRASVVNEMPEFRGVSKEVEGAAAGYYSFSIALDGKGECLVDDLSVEDVDYPGTNLVRNGGFTSGTDGWNISSAGYYRNSSWSADGGVGGTGALKLVALTPCRDDCTFTSGITSRLPLQVSPTKQYRISMKYRCLRGNAVVVFSLGPDIQIRAERPNGLWGGHTAGRPNSAAAETPAPFVIGRGRFPRRPSSTDSPLVTVLVRSVLPPASVTLTRVLDDGGPLEQHPLFDDGAHGDREASDGLWGCFLPQQPHGTAFRYTLSIVDAAGDEWIHPDPKEPVKQYGYFVNDIEAAPHLPDYQLILPGLGDVTMDSVNQYLSCSSYRLASFAFEGDLYPDVAVRFRGNTGCFLQKRLFKVRFNHGGYFQGLRKININSMWTDKALFREHIAWDLLRRIGSAYCETEFVRLFINGEYYGFFMTLEHPDSRFLDRNGLDRDGGLYKARMGPYEYNNPCGWTPGFHRYGSVDEYRRYWEKETNQDSDFFPLPDFINTMHDTGGRLSFFQEQVDPESVILFQAGQIALRNYDSTVKNHFLYRDSATGIWGVLPWDLDLCFGKYFTFDAVEYPQRPVGTLNDAMSCPEFGADLYYGGAMTGCGFPDNWLVYYFLNTGFSYYRRAYHIRMWTILSEQLSVDAVGPRIDELYETFYDAHKSDIAKWGRYESNLDPEEAPPSAIEPNIEILKQQITCHRQQLLSFFSIDIREHPRLRINELFVMPADGDADERGEFVELYNPDPWEVDVSSWRIDGVDFVFPDDVTVPAQGTIVVAKDPEFFAAKYGFAPFGPYPGRLDNQGEHIKVYDAGLNGDYPAVVDHVEYDNGGRWPELWSGFSIEFTQSDRWVDNNDGGLWRRSQNEGGTPSMISAVPLFTRGDVNQDGGVNLADVVTLLAYLFAAADEPLCMDSADAGDDGKVNISDVVYLLAYQFGGGAPPRPPFYQCGLDTGESLGCKSYDPCR